MNYLKKILFTFHFSLCVFSIYSQKDYIEANGILFNQHIKVKVDCELAKLMLTQPDNSLVIDLFNTYKNHPLNTQTMADIYYDYSADVATLYLLQRSYQKCKNKEIQDNYYNYINQLNNNQHIAALAQLKHYYIVLIPGLAYKDFPHTGANFKRQRNLLKLHNINHCFIKTKQWGAVEVNAKIIADELKKICLQHDNVILVSSSKSGLETAVVIGQMLNSEETKNIKAWISVAGILRGSPIADYFLTPSKTAISKIYLFIKGKKIDMLQSMSYRNRRKTFDDFNFPKHINIIHYLGAPLATEIRPKIKNRYTYMLPLGPNDGFTPLADQIYDEGRVVAEIGVDHYFKDANIDIKALALLLSCVKHIENTSNNITSIK